MNINKAKEKVLNLKKHKLKIKVYIGRNKFEYYEGKIKDIHPNLFTIMTDKGLKSYTYSDILTKIVVLTKF